MTAKDDSSCLKANRRVRISNVGLTGMSSVKSKVQSEEELINTVADVGIASSENAVSAAESAGTGYWTQWINVDKTMEHGTGEFEDCSRIIYEQNKDQKCYLGCKAPLAARYSLVNAQTTATWTDIGTVCRRCN